MKNAYEIRGDITAIFVNYKRKQYEALINTSDLEKMSAYPNTWVGTKPRSRSTIYVMMRMPGGKSFPLLHRVIMNAQNGQLVDHENHNGLDNTRLNLRFVTASKNQHNRARSTGKSGLKGVHFCKKTNRWKGELMINRVNYFLGRFDTPEEASTAVETKRKEIYRE